MFGRGKSKEKIGHFLGIDYGASWIGLAIADSVLRIAFAYATLQNDKEFIKKLGKIIKKEQVREVVIGEVKTNGKYQKPFEAREIGEKIAREFSVKVNYVSEMFTTKIAQRNLKEGEKKKINKLDNQEAARIILQDWIDGGVT